MIPRQVAAVLLLVALCASTVQAQTSLDEALAKGKYDLFRKIVDCAGATKAFQGTKGEVTVLAPTDAAIVAFLKAMGLSAAEVLMQEELCDTILRYHVIPLGLTSSMLVKKDSKVQTLEDWSYLTFNKGSGGVTVTDMQGNVAKVLRGDVKAGEAILHRVDRVLLSGELFTSVIKALEYHSDRHTSLVGALTSTGLIKRFNNPKAPFKGTILAPTEAAFKKLGAVPAKDTLKNVLLYHVLKDKVVLPTGIKPGFKYATAFPGHTVGLKLSMTTFKPKVGPVVKAGLVEVIPETGAPAKVMKHNVFAGQAIIHGINSVLIPKLGTVAEKGAINGHHHHHRKLMYGGYAHNTDLDFRQQSALFSTAGAIADAATGQTSAGTATAVGTATANSVGLFDGY